VHSETVDMLFTAKRVTREKRRSGKAFRQIVRCTENFALWTAKPARRRPMVAHSPVSTSLPLVRRSVMGSVTYLVMGSAPYVARRAQKNLLNVSYLTLPPAANGAGCSSGLSAIGGPMAFEGEPGVCDICKAGRLIRDVETIRFRQMSDKGFVNCRADVVTYTCDSCQTKTIDPAAKSAFDEAFKREYDKLP
jgi:hypothetical protein